MIPKLGCVKHKKSEWLHQNEDKHRQAMDTFNEKLVTICCIACEVYPFHIWISVHVMSLLRTHEGQKLISVLRSAVSFRDLILIGLTWVNCNNRRRFRWEMGNVSLRKTGEMGTQIFV